MEFSLYGTTFDTDRLRQFIEQALQTGDAAVELEARITQLESETVNHKDKIEEIEKDNEILEEQLEAQIKVNDNLGETNSELQTQIDELIKELERKDSKIIDLEYQLYGRESA